MKSRPHSASSVKMFLQCLQKYHFRYVDKKPSELNRTPLALGTAVHAALEEMYKVVLEAGTLPTEEMYNHVIKTYYQSAAKEGLSDLAALEEGRRMVISRLDKVTLDEKIVSLEARFSLETPKGTPFGGAIDKVVELDEDTLVIIDYKTSRTALTQEEADKDIQMSMYDLAASIMYPQYKKVILVLDYVRLEDAVYTHRTEEQRKVFTEYLDIIFERMANLEKVDMVPTLNVFCGWCDYSAFCPEFKKVVEDPDLQLKRPDTMTEDEFIDAWTRASDVGRAVTQYKNKLKMEISKRVRSGDKKNIVGKSKEMYQVQNARVSYDAKYLFKVLPPTVLPPLMTANNSAVKKFLQNNPQYQEEIEGAMSTAYNAPFYKSRSLKKKK